MDAIVKKMGFEDLKEFNHLVAKVDVSTPDERFRFKFWQDHDGTKKGLLMLLDGQAERKASGGTHASEGSE